MRRNRMTRRRFVVGTTAATAVAIAAPYVRTASAAGSLTLGLWDHWVPGANDTCTKIINEWAEREKVDVKVDYITAQGNKLLLTVAAEAQARAGHDVLMMSNWLPNEHAERLEPVDDVMSRLIEEHGPVYPAIETFGKVDGHWVGVPSIRGTLAYCCATRMDHLKQHAGIDVQAMYPAGQPAKADAWTLDTFLKAAEACHKGGKPFGIGLGETSDSVDAAGAFLQAFGGALVNAKGDITVKTDAVRQWLEFYKKLMAFMPKDVSAWDDSSNNKWLVSGNGALIMNPPSSWAVAKRDAPQIAEQCWTHGMPAGPAGRFSPFLPFFWSVWNFSKNKAASKSLLVHLSQPEQAEAMVNASGGYDLPSFANMTKFKVWAEEAPPKGTLYHYANPNGFDTWSIAAAPAPPKIAQQIYAQATHTKMCVRYFQGEPMEKTLAWAESELEGFMRT